jgi:hypothetical protein
MQLRRPQLNLFPTSTQSLPQSINAIDAIGSNTSSLLKFKDKSKLNGLENQFNRHCNRSGVFSNFILNVFIIKKCRIFLNQKWYGASSSSSGHFFDSWVRL